MKMVFILSLLISLTAHSKSKPFAATGGESSGGGGGFYCAGSDSVEVLDLWEGRHPQLHRYNIPSSSDDYKVQLNKAIAKLTEIYPSAGNGAKREIERLEKQAKPIDPAITQLPFPDDAKPKFVKPNCVVRGIMYYDGGTETLWYDPSLLSKLSQTDLAAIWLHEGLYKFLRSSFGEKNSVAARRIVACSFSASGCTDKLLKLEQILPADKPVYKCENSSSTWYYFYQNGQFKLVFTRNSEFVLRPDITYPLIVTGPRFPRFPTGIVNISDKSNYWEPFRNEEWRARPQGLEDTNFMVTMVAIIYSKMGGVMPFMSNWNNAGASNEDTHCVHVNNVAPEPPKDQDTFPPNPDYTSATTVVTY